MSNSCACCIVSELPLSYILLSCNWKTISYSAHVINILLIMKMFLDQRRPYNKFTAWVNIYLIAPIGWYTGCYSVFLPKGVWNNVRTKWGYYFEVKIITERSEVIIFENCTNEMSAIFLFHERVYECMKCKHPLEGRPNSVRYTNQAVWLYLL